MSAQFLRDLKQQAELMHKMDARITRLALMVSAQQTRIEQLEARKTLHLKDKNDSRTSKTA